MTECAHSYLIKQEVTSKSLLRALRIAIRQRTDRQLTALQQHPGDSSDAQRLLRRSNWAMSMLPRDMPPVLADLVSHLSTSGGANEAVLAALSVSVNRLQDDMKAVGSDVKAMSGEMREVSSQLATLCSNHQTMERAIAQKTVTITQLEAVVHGPDTSLVSRVDRIEREHTAQQNARSTRHQTFREMFVQLVPVIATWIGALLTGFFLYFGHK